MWKFTAMCLTLLLFFPPLIHYSGEHLNFIRSFPFKSPLSAGLDSNELLKYCYFPTPYISYWNSSFSKDKYESTYDVNLVTQNLIISPIQLSTFWYMRKSKLSNWAIKHMIIYNSNFQKCKLACRVPFLSTAILKKTLSSRKNLAVSSEHSTKMISFSENSETNWYTYMQGLLSNTQVFSINHLKFMWNWNSEPEWNTSDYFKASRPSELAFFLLFCWG